MSCKIKAYRKCLLAIPLAVLFHLDCFHKTEPDLIGTLNDFLIRSFFDQRTYSTAGRYALLLAFESMAIFLFFSFIWGADIYREMHTRGIYVVTRVRHKGWWIAGLVGKLAKEAAVFSTLYSGVTLFLWKMYTKMPFNGESPFAFFLVVFFLFLTSFLLALLVNGICIDTSVKTGSICGVIVLLALVMEVVGYDQIPGLGRIYVLHYLNPLFLCNLFYEKSPGVVAGWLVYYIFLGLAATAIFCICVKQTEIRLVQEDR